MKKKLLYLAQLKDSSGFSVSARGYFKVLTEMQDIFDVKCVNFTFEDRVEEHSWVDKFILKEADYKEWSEGGFVLLWHMTVGAAQAAGSLDLEKGKAKFIQKLFFDCDKNISITCWETDRMPDEWQKVYKKYKTQKALVPCIWNKDTLSKHINTDYIPYLVDVKENAVSKIDSGYRKLFKDNFVFLSISQWSYRKGFDILLKSYLTEFVDHDDTILVLKSYLSNMINSSTPEEQFKILKLEIEKIKSCINLSDGQKFPKIMLIHNMLTESKIEELYDASDVYISATRGEGFGLTIAESCIKGLPLIATDKGGHVDYLDDQFYKIESDSVPCYNMPSHLYSSLGNHFEPRIYSCMEKMREVYELKKQGKKLKTSKDFTKEYLSPARVKKLLKEFLLKEG